MRAEQRHTSKSSQRAYEQRWLLVQRSRGKKFKSVVILHRNKRTKKKKEKHKEMKKKPLPSSPGLCHCLADL